MSPLRRSSSLVLSIAVVAVSARVDLPAPGSPVPQSLQTLAVLLVGVLLGGRWGAGALLMYGAAGALGLPVFADGAGGVGHLLGPTGGYLAGFVAAAGLVGTGAERGWTAYFGPALGLMVAAHTVILGLGWLRLATLVGGASAWASGVRPFLVGGLVKSAVAALLAVWLTRRLRGDAGGTNLFGSEALDASE